MRKLIGALIIFLVAAISCTGAASAAQTKAPGTESGQQTTNNKATATNIICYDKFVTKEELKLGVKPPCAPSNFIHVPLEEVQKYVLHDRDNIWADGEMWSPRGSSILENTIKIKSVEVTVSMVVGAPCGKPSLCPFRVRFRIPGKKDIIKGWPEFNQGCASGSYYFIRDDLKELIACDERFPLF